MTVPVRPNMLSFVATTSFGRPATKGNHMTRPLSLPTHALVLLFFLVPAVVIYAQENTHTSQGPYFGLVPPGNEAVVFAKNIISTDAYEHSAPAFSADGKTVLWTVVERDRPARLVEITMEGNNWSQPHAPSFADSLHDDFYPFFSIDGKQLFFSSRRPLPSGLPVKDMALWAVEHKADGWGVPVPVDTTISHTVEYAHSLSRRGTLFFSLREMVNGKARWSIYTASFLNGSYAPSQPLDTSINDGSYVDGPLVAPDESFLIFESDRPGGMGSTDLYICFKKNGQWSAPKNMGPSINSPKAERFAGLSPGGKYLFFGSNRSGELPDVYWISASIIDSLK